MKFPILSLVALVALSFIAADAADAQHFDVFLARPAVGNQTVIGGAGVDNLAYDDVTRVFEVELGELGAEFFALEPGVNHPNTNFPTNAYPASASPLVPGDTLRLLKTSFSVGGDVADLFYWNGVGPVSFSPAAANFRIELGDPLTDTPGVGGSFDDHPFFFIDDISLPGVYLASAYGVVDGYAPSASVYLVMGTESLITPAFLGITQEEFDLLDEEELDEALELVIEQAAEWVESNIVVPEPGTLVLASVASCGLLLTSRRQRLHEFRA